MARRRDKQVTGRQDRQYIKREIKKRTATRRDTPRNGWCTPYAAVRRSFPRSWPCRATFPAGIRCAGSPLGGCGYVGAGRRGAVEQGGLDGVVGK
jgi:hypothetical protein